MKKQEISLTKEWNLKRAVRVSLKIAYIYAFLSGIWILIFGNKPEIIWKINLGGPSKSIVLPWHPVFNILLDMILVLLLGILIYSISKFLIYFAKEFDNDISTAFWIFLIVGILFSFAVISGSGLVFHLVLGLIAGGIFWISSLTLACLIAGSMGGIFYLLKFLFSEKPWKWLGKEIVLGWEWLIR